MTIKDCEEFEHVGNLPEQTDQLILRAPSIYCSSLFVHFVFFPRPNLSKLNVNMTNQRQPPC